MDTQVIQKLQNQFDALSHKIPDEDVEFWFARELQEPLGYTRWENFMTAISRAIESCKTTGYDENNHFRGVTKMVKIGSGSERPIQDIPSTNEF
jgi:DNA-damage-inducible protein D